MKVVQSNNGPRLRDKKMNTDGKSNMLCTMYLQGGKHWCNFWSTEPQFKLCSRTSKSLNWGSVDQKLHQCLPPCRYLVHSILLFPSVFIFFIPQSWAIVGLNNLHQNVPCYLLKFQLGFLQDFFKRGSGLPMVLSSLSKCMILTYGREIWPSSFYL